MEEIVLHDKTFVKCISENQIKEKVKEIAEVVNNISDISSENTLFISVLNGSFMFTSDLCREVLFSPEIQFIKVKSYDKLESTGNIKEIIGLTTPIEDKIVFIIEDIIDTGNTISELYTKINAMNPKKVYVITLFYKPDKYKGGMIENVLSGFTIPNDFIVGYGLDYDELGRNLKDIYILKE